MSIFSINTFNLKNYFVQKVRKSSFVWKFVELAQGISFYISYYLYYKFKFTKWGNSIREIHLEFVSYCNLRCQLCSLDHEKTKVRMSEATLILFFEDFLSDRNFRKVNTIHLYNAGEVLLHPNLEKMLGIIKSFKIKAAKENIKFPEIGLLTNASLLNEINSKILIDSGILSHIRFSMDGGSKEKFEEMRERAKWDVFVDNIRTFCRLNNASAKPIATGIISLLEFKNKLSTEWMSSEFVELLNIVDGYELRYAHNWAGEVKIEELEKRKKKKSLKMGCSLLMHQLVLLPNGDITVCCADLNSKGVVGNISQEKLGAIYNSKKRIDMLQKFVKGKKNEIDLCKDCETF
ncbi:MAG: radical SAM/SPASM domain-containing protein [Bacteroidia bacterium]